MDPMTLATLRERALRQGWEIEHRKANAPVLRTMRLTRPGSDLIIDAFGVGPFGLRYFLSRQQPNGRTVQVGEITAADLDGVLASVEQTA